MKNNNYKYFYLWTVNLLFAFFFIPCCSSPSGADDFFGSDRQGVKISSQKMYMDSSVISMYCYEVIGDRLIQYWTHAPYLYRVYNIRGDSLLYEGKFAYLGNGPYEMKMPFLKYRKKENKLIIYSASSSDPRFYTVDLSDFSHVYDTRYWEEKRMPDMNYKGDLEFLNDSVLLHTGLTEEYRLFSLAYAGQNGYNRCLDFPYPDGRKDQELWQKKLLYKGILLRHPDEDRFIYSNEFSKYVMTFDIIEGQMTNIRILSGKVPDYKVNKDNIYNPFTFNKESERGCESIQGTSKYIYIGYNNSTWEDMRGNGLINDLPFHYFDRVNVFDWNGNFIRRLILDTPIGFFAVSEDDKFMYGTTRDKENEENPYVVLRFDLKNNLN